MRRDTGRGTDWAGLPVIATVAQLLCHTGHIRDETPDSDSNLKGYFMPRTPGLRQLLQRPSSASGDRQPDTGPRSRRRGGAGWQGFGGRTHSGTRAVPGRLAQLVLPKGRVVTTGGACPT
jgi:hypothetical protein